ncbi:TPA: tail fiber assembly protein [Enterobacter roggenkampii]
MNGPRRQLRGIVPLITQYARADIAYEKATGAPAIVKTLGPLSDDLTSITPVTPYDKWDGSQWVTDIDAQHAADVASADATKSALRAVADDEIKWRQDAVDAGIATEGEVATLAEWIKYRVFLMRVDTSTAPDIVWPSST